MESNKEEGEAGTSGVGEAEAGDSLYEKKWNAAFARLKAFKAKFGEFVLAYYYRVRTMKAAIY